MGRVIDAMMGMLGRIRGKLSLQRIRSSIRGSCRCGGHVSRPRRRRAEPSTRPESSAERPDGHYSHDRNQSKAHGEDRAPFSLCKRANAKQTASALIFCALLVEVNGAKPLNCVQMDCRIVSRKTRSKFLWRNCKSGWHELPSVIHLNDNGSKGTARSCSLIVWLSIELIHDPENL